MMDKENLVKLALYHRGRANRMTVCANGPGVSCSQRKAFGAMSASAWRDAGTLMERARFEGGMTKRRKYLISRAFVAVATVHALTRDEAGELYEAQCLAEGVECDSYLLSQPMSQVQGPSRFVGWGAVL
jgi:hypothetical protein